MRKRKEERKFLREFNHNLKKYYQDYKRHTGYVPISAEEDRREEFLFIEAVKKQLREDFNVD